MKIPNPTVFLSQKKLFLYLEDNSLAVHPEVTNWEDLPLKVRIVFREGGFLYPLEGYEAEVSLEKFGPDMKKHYVATIATIKSESQEDIIHQIDFGQHVRCQIKIVGKNIEVVKAIDGWGNQISEQEISVYRP